MPPTARQSQAKEIEALKKQVAAQNHLIAAKNRQLAKLKVEANARNLEGKDDRIPIPEGQAGRQQGYNLFKEMRVSKETYHVLRSLVHHKSTQYLNITKSLQHQDKSDLRTAKLEIAKQIPFLIKYYHAAWPIGPILKQFLWSSSKSYKKAKAYLEHLKEVPTPLPAGARTTAPRAGARNRNSSDEDELDQAPTRLTALKLIPLESSDEDAPVLSRLTLHPTTHAVKKAQKSLNAGADASDEDEDPAAAKVKPQLQSPSKVQHRKAQKSFKGIAGASDEDGNLVPAKVNPRSTTVKKAKKKLLQADVGTSDEDGDLVPAKVNPRSTTMKKAQKKLLQADMGTSDEDGDLVPAKVNPRSTTMKKAQKLLKAGMGASGKDVPAKVNPRAIIEDEDLDPVSSVVFSDSDKDEPDNLSDLSDEVKFGDGECAEEVEQLRLELEATEEPQDLDLEIIPPLPNASKHLSQLVKGKYPVYCPNYDSETCNDKFPINPGARVKLLFEQVQDLHHNPDAPKHTTGEPRGLEMKIMELCLAIAAENKFQITGDKGHSWPTNIDFSQLHDRILNLDKREIWGLLANSIVLHNAVAWQTFIGTLTSGSASPTFLKWSNMPAMQKFDIFGQANFSGYYGLARQQIVTATLQYHIYSQDNGAVEMLAETMGDILDTHSHEDLPMGRFWSRSTPTTLSLLDFICYMAAPHVINMLICVDLFVPEREADKIHLESCSHGSYFHDTTEEIDDLVMCIAKGCPIPLAHNHSNHRPEDSSQPSQGHSNQAKISGNSMQTRFNAPSVIHSNKVGPSWLDFTVGSPGRLACKQVATPSSSIPKKRSRDDNKENDIGERLDLAAQAKKKRKGMQVVKFSGELRRSARHKDKCDQA